MAGPGLIACGAINWDSTLFVEHLPSAGGEVTVTEVAPIPGGTGANVAVAAARLLGQEQVGFVGAVGEDAVAQSQRGILEEEGVVTKGLRVIGDTMSGHAYIMVDREGRNVIATALGANAALNADHLREQGVREVLQAAQVYAVTDPPLEVVEVLLQSAATTGAQVLWDPGIHVDQGWEALSSLARRANTLLLNEVEAERLLGETEPGAVARRLLDAGWRNQVVLKRGAEGAILLDLASRRLYSTPALPLEAMGLHAINSVGSGDAFLGALAAMQCLDYRAPQALARAACAGSLKASRPGTRDSPTWEELQAAYSRWEALGVCLRQEALV